MGSLVCIGNVMWLRFFFFLQNALHPRTRISLDMPLTVHLAQLTQVTR